MKVKTTLVILFRFRVILFYSKVNLHKRNIYSRFLKLSTAMGWVTEYGKYISALCALI